MDHNSLIFGGIVFGIFTAFTIIGFFLENAEWVNDLSDDYPFGGQ